MWYDELVIRRSTWRFRLAALGLMVQAVLLTGCAPKRVVPAPGGVVGPLLPDERTPIPWAASEEYFVVIRRSCRTLGIYRYGEWIQSYHDVAFGREPGIKLHEGDRRTPLGLYKIIGRRHHPRWARFLLIDYPNLHDVASHRVAVGNGLAPARIGGQVGIHGTDKPRFNELGIDWTFGCVSLHNEDVIELYEIVPDGTLVWIAD